MALRETVKRTAKGYRAKSKIREVRTKTHKDTDNFLVTVETG
jgi:hypothetical protein